MEKTRYFVIKNKAGELMTLARILTNDSELWGEYFSDDGKWIEDHVMTNFLIDPLMGDEIEKEEAEELINKWGYNIKL
ncbi:MAG TPA: hypothetical protein VL401_00090 [Alphaproteobacteria bacterium]|jgi:hypothetical protein|nr:hypothetical protein [Alphaproteobacteria bacterium]